MNIKAIVALGPHNVIGNKGHLPWDTIYEDLQLFKKTTRGHPIIMGRKTWDSLQKQSLPGRTNIVLSRDQYFEANQALVARSVSDACQHAWSAFGNEGCFIIGGAQIYKLFLELTDEILLTRVFGEYSGDTFFPHFEHEFERKDNENIQFSRSGVQFRFEHWVRN